MNKPSPADTKAAEKILSEYDTASLTEIAQIIADSRPAPQETPKPLTQDDLQEDPEGKVIDLLTPKVEGDAGYQDIGEAIDDIRSAIGDRDNLAGLDDISAVFVRQRLIGIDKAAKILSAKLTASEARVKELENER